jgi:pyruvate formate lyase activating enzyme
MIGYLRNIIPYSAVDGPGNRTVVFLQGCNLNCLYCHNPETIQIASTTNLIEHVKQVTVEDLCERLRPYYDFTSGITFSGGECTLQSEFLIAVCGQLRAENRHILIDTNAYANAETIAQLIPLVDGFMVDIKAYEDSEHIELTGKSNQIILKNLSMIAQAKKLYEIRTVIVSELLSNEMTVKAVSEFIADKTPQTRYKLIKYRPHGVRNEYINQMKSPEAAYMGKLFKLAKDSGVGDIILV